MPHGHRLPLWRHLRRAMRRAIALLPFALAILTCTTGPDLAGAAATPTRTPGVRIVASATTVAPNSKVTLTAYGLGAGTIVVKWNGGTIGTFKTTGFATQPFILVVTIPVMSAPDAVTVSLINASTGAHGDIHLTITSHAASSGQHGTPTPAPTPLPPSAGIPTHGKTANGCAITAEQASAEQYLLNLLNKHRKAAGVNPLTLNPTLSLASREHSCEMFLRLKLQHPSADGSSPFDRFSRHGVKFMAAGENIGTTSGYSAIAGIDSVDNSMMAEPNVEGTHHWNIVHAAYTSAGIGVIIAKGQMWMTEDFVG